MDEEVSKFAWQSGYALVLIGGGCTGAIQPLDTHVQGAFSKQYQEMEVLIWCAERARIQMDCPASAALNSLQTLSRYGEKVICICWAAKVFVKTCMI